MQVMRCWGGRRGRGGEVGDRGGAVGGSGGTGGPGGRILAAPQLTGPQHRERRWSADGGRQRAGPCAPRGDTRSAPARRSRGAAVVEFRGGSEAVVTRALLPALFHLLHEAAAVAPR